MLSKVKIFWFLLRKIIQCVLQKKCEKASEIKRNEKVAKNSAFLPQKKLLSNNIFAWKVDLHPKGKVQKVLWKAFLKNQELLRRFSSSMTWLFCLILLLLRNLKHIIHSLLFDFDNLFCKPFLLLFICLFVSQKKGFLARIWIVNHVRSNDIIFDLRGHLRSKSS